MFKKSLFDKIWDHHIVEHLENNNDIIYIDRQYLHEVTSPQAFSEINKRNVSIFRPSQITATMDHNVPTQNQLNIKNKLSKKQIELLQYNCTRNNIKLYDLHHKYQGIVHVIGPELGLTLPGMTIVCGDSHTSTHGAFGTISFGIGTSQVAMVMATQCLILNKPKQMKIKIEGDLNKHVFPKDIIIHIISKLGTHAGTGFFIEFTGSTIRNMSMEGRMTICNMSIEMGARGGLIAPDKKTFEYIKNTDLGPKNTHLAKGIDFWKTLKTDTNFSFDQEYVFYTKNIYPTITYGTNPGMAIQVDEHIPNKNNNPQFMKSLKYMNLKPKESLLGKKINYVFIGSCTNSRIEDLRIVAKVVKGKKKAKHVTAIIVPGSKKVMRQAIKEGIDKIFQQANLELREPGCSACLGMNEDKIPAGAYCVSTSNRNFEGRQGKGARTILSSPLIAAITAIEGKIVNINKYQI